MYISASMPLLYHKIIRCQCKIQLNHLSEVERNRQLDGTWWRTRGLGRAMGKDIFFIFFKEQEVTVAQAFSRKILLNKLKFLNEDREI